ncbi:Gx transporter family protein [Treponema sp.]|uniref:Gx transporter family protein n=1 Tax=Treponema sp. TaxID=166 RepID=UPI003F10DFCE
MEKNDWNRIAFFASLCFFLSALEYAVPKLLPFFKIGFANLPVMLSFPLMKKKETFMLVLLKVFFQAVVGGTIFSYVFVFSFAGSVASALAMMFCFSCFRGRVSFAGISLCGALFNNAAQIILARFFIFGSNVAFIAPPMLCASFFSSLALGIFAERFSEKSVWFKELACGSPRALALDVSSRVRFPFFSAAVSLVFFCVLIFGKSPVEIYSVGFLSALLVFFKKGSVKILPPLAVTLFIVFFSLFSPQGKILFSIGGLDVTLGALTFGAVKAGRLCGFVFVSKFLVSENMFFRGRAGSVFSLVMGYFSRLTETKIQLSWKNIISVIDSRLCAVWNGES